MPADMAVFLYCLVMAVLRFFGFRIVYTLKNLIGDHKEPFLCGLSSVFTVFEIKIEQF